ncbi:MAG: 3-deoxy-D-manno-octulosonic acid transferase [Rhodoferax sp.]|nr:3-deoxy-D-manno-octulosonic acid transferase [Rhodoferax sp.]
MQTLQTLALAVYSLLTRLLQPALRWKLRRRARSEPAYAQHVEQRFGRYGSAALQAGPVLWVHSVSLGETRAIGALIALLRAQWPGMRLLLTHGTATGLDAGADLLQAGDLQVWQPWDTPAATRSFVQHFRPRLGLLVDTEIWPNLVRACAQASVPLCLVNARLSAHSLQRAQRLHWLAEPAYQSLAGVWPQDEDQATRFRALGVKPHAPTGNIKFDMEPDLALWSQGQAVRQAQLRPVLMLAVSREGEEQMWLDAMRHAQANGLGMDRVQCLIVPRHPQRFDAVADLLQSAGLSVARRSVDGAQFSVADVWLGDTLGEMAFYYGLADVALLGGSFAPLGGQNLIEAAACRCPVVMGPHTFNFAQAADMAQEAGAALVRPDMASALHAAMQLLEDKAALEAAGSAAWAFAQTHRGAALRLSRALDVLWRQG